MSIQRAAIESTTTRSDPGMKPGPAHTDSILRDDIRWLESRIQQLEATSRASGYRQLLSKLLRQRQHQLASRANQDGICPGCWQDYFC